MAAWQGFGDGVDAFVGPWVASGVGWWSLTVQRRPWWRQNSGSVSWGEVGQASFVVILLKVKTLKKNSIFWGVLRLTGLHLEAPSY